jgi:hypothetical protein
MGFIYVGIALYYLLDVSYGLLFPEFSFLFNLLGQSSTLAKLSDNEDLVIPRMLRDDLEDVLLAVEFPESVELLHELPLFLGVGEVRLGIALEDKGDGIGMTPVDCLVDFALLAGVEKVVLVGVLAHAN